MHEHRASDMIELYGKRLRPHLVHQLGFFLLAKKKKDWNVLNELSSVGCTGFSHISGKLDVTADVAIVIKFWILSGGGGFPYKAYKLKSKLTANPVSFNIVNV